MTRLSLKSHIGHILQFFSSIPHIPTSNTSNLARYKYPISKLRVLPLSLTRVRARQSFTDERPLHLLELTDLCVFRFDVWKKLFTVPHIHISMLTKGLTKSKFAA